MGGEREGARWRSSVRLVLGFGAASVNYGRIPADADVLLRGACPIVGSYGAKDRTLKGAAQRLNAVLATLNVEHDIVEYPNAGHSFLNDYPDNFLFTAMRPLIGAGYHEESAVDARRRILSFFGQHLAR